VDVLELVPNPFCDCVLFVAGIDKGQVVLAVIVKPEGGLLRGFVFGGGWGHGFLLFRGAAGRAGTGHDAGSL
jgi:hypothetical protein